MSFDPKFTVTTEILELFGNISEMIGQFEGRNIVDVSPKLRKENQVKTIFSTCAIEGNSLGVERVTDILDNKRVEGSAREIAEIKNALALYDSKNNFDFKNEKDLLRAHQILMKGLLVDAGEFRRGGVAVFDGQQIIHMGPEFQKVPGLVKDLMGWITRKNDTNLLIQSAIFHFEFERIHPFMDGNGRMGRFWQYLMLIQHHPIFRFVPVESIIHDHQKDYYKALQQAQAEGQITAFIHFSLFTIAEALQQVLDEAGGYQKNSSGTRLESFLQSFSEKEFSRKDYLQYFKGISDLTASRDLAFGVKSNVLDRHGDKRLARYKIISRTLAENTQKAS